MRFTGYPSAVVLGRGSTALGEEIWQSGNAVLSSYLGAAVNDPSRKTCFDNPSQPKRKPKMNNRIN
jgi:hypothetical protein